MKELLDKITSYNLFNYLLPGVLFAVLATKFTRFSLIQPDIIVGAFVYYFIGLVISRLGSLLLEPFLKLVRFVKFADYDKYVAACKVDEKIDVLSEQNNSYRTLAAVFACLLLVKAYEMLESRVAFLTHRGTLVAIALLLMMFLLSYRKQTKYITKRVKAATGDDKAKAARA